MFNNKDMKSYKNKEKMNNKSKVFSKKNLNLLGVFFIFIITSSMLGFSLKSFNISKEIKNITSSWAPNISDLGKLKFVINNDSLEEDVNLNTSLMGMPFDYCVAEETKKGEFLVNGLGGILVKSCMDGRVVKIEGETIKTVYISHGKSLTSVYGNIDNLGVKVNDKVNKNTPIGVSEKSKISFKMLYKNKPVAGLTVKDSELTFD